MCGLNQSLYTSTALGDDNQKNLTNLNANDMQNINIGRSFIAFRTYS